jgi:hypothetical protein
MAEVDACIKEAIETIENFVKETTGNAPTPEEIAGALKRYFVLKEIGEHIKMVRNNSEE